MVKKQKFVCSVCGREVIKQEFGEAWWFHLPLFGDACPTHIKGNPINYLRHAQNSMDGVVDNLLPFEEDGSDGNSATSASPPDGGRSIPKATGDK